MKHGIGMAAVMLGLIGLMFTTGGVDNAQTTEQWIAVAGVGFTSALLAYVGTLILNDRI